MDLSQVSSRAAGALGVLQLAAALGPPRRKSAQPESERRRQAAALRGASPRKADFLKMKFSDERRDESDPVDRSGRWAKPSQASSIR